MSSRLSGHFIEGSRGRLFVSLRRPAEPHGSCVLVVPPFAEEMNKCRRMVALAAQGLADRGIAVAIPDLFGTGDSEGDFGEASWSAWVDDLRVAREWLGQQGLNVSGLLCVRLGAALAVEALHSDALPPVSRTVLWQPVLDGGRFLNQFLRLRIAATFMTGGRKETTAGLRASIASGEQVEVAGYALGALLVAQIDALRVPKGLPVGAGRVAWYETVREASDPMSALSRQMAEAALACGSSFETEGFTGEPFWNSTEVVVIPDFVARTVAMLGCLE
jgi:exosortase A-associated hydrolase 2